MASYPGNQSTYYGPRGGVEPNQGRMWGPQMGMTNRPPQMGPPNGPGYSNMYNIGPNMQQGMPTQQHQMDGSYGSDMNQYAGQGPGMGHPQRAAMPSNQGSQPPGAPPPIIQSGPGPRVPGGYPPGPQGPHEAMGPPTMPQQATGPPGGMMSQGPGPPPAYNQNLNVPYNGDQSGNQSGMGNQGGISGSGGQQMYPQNDMPSGPPAGPMHPHLRNQPQNPQQVADSILQMASSNYNSPITRYRHPIPPQGQQGGPMHNPQMMQQMGSNQYGTGQRMQQPGMGHFVYPNKSPMPPQSSASPMSPMQQVQSPASMHSNTSMPSTSPGPMRSPVPTGMPPNPSPGLGNMRSPVGPQMHPQSMGSGQQQPQIPPSMKSPVHTPHSMPPNMSPLNPGSQGQPSPASGPPMCSPNHQMATPASMPSFPPDGNSYQINSHSAMSTSSGQSSPSTFSTCSQPTSMAPPPSNVMQNHPTGPGPSPGAPPLQHQQLPGSVPPHPMVNQGANQMYPQQQQQQQNMNCQNTPSSNAFTNASSSAMFTSPSPTYTSNTAPVQQQTHPASSVAMNNPLQSLQKLVMLPESQVVDPKSVVNDACLPSSGDDMSSAKAEEDINSKNLIDELRSTPQACSNTTTNNLGSSHPFQGLNAQSEQQALLVSHTSDNAVHSSTAALDTGVTSDNESSAAGSSSTTPTQLMLPATGDAADITSSEKSPKKRGRRKRKSEEDKSSVVNGCMDGDFVPRELKSPRKILQTGNSLAAILSEECETVIEEKGDVTKCNSKRDTKNRRDNGDDDDKRDDDTSESVHYVMSDLKMETKELPDDDIFTFTDEKVEPLSELCAKMEYVRKCNSSNQKNCSIGNADKKELTSKDKDTFVRISPKPKNLNVANEIKHKSAHCSENVDDNHNSMETKIKPKSPKGKVKKGNEAKASVQSDENKVNIKEEIVEKVDKDEGTVCDAPNLAQNEKESLNQEDITESSGVNAKTGKKKSAKKKKRVSETDQNDYDKMNYCGEETDVGLPSKKKKCTKKRKSADNCQEKTPEKSESVPAGGSGAEKINKSPSGSITNPISPPDSVFVTPDKSYIGSTETSKGSPGKKRTKKPSGETSSSISDDSKDDLSLTVSELTDGTKDVPKQVKRKRRKRKSSEISGKSEGDGLQSIEVGNGTSAKSNDWKDYNSSENNTTTEKHSPSETARGIGSTDIDDKNCQLEMEVECIDETEEDDGKTGDMAGTPSGRRKRKQTVMPNFVGLDEHWGDSDDEDDKDFVPKAKAGKKTPKKSSLDSGKMTQPAKKTPGNIGKRAKKTPPAKNKSKPGDLEVKHEFEELSIKISPEPSDSVMHDESNSPGTPQASTSSLLTVKTSPAARSANSSPRAKKRKTDNSSNITNKGKKRKRGKNFPPGPGLLAIDSDNETKVGRLDLKNAIKLAKSKNKVKKVSKKDDNSYSGPMVRLKGGKETPTSVEIVNTHDGADADRFTKRKGRHGNEIQSERNANTLTYPMSDTVPWICAFCGKSTNYSILGDLFGPYFLENSGTSNSGALMSPTNGPGGSSSEETEQMTNKKRSKPHSKRCPTGASTSTAAAAGCSGRESKRRRWASKEAMLHRFLSLYTYFLLWKEDTRVVLTLERYRCFISYLQSNRQSSQPVVPHRCPARGLVPRGLRHVVSWCVPRGQ